jgi:hypothetical protein
MLERRRRKENNRGKKCPSCGRKREVRGERKHRFCEYNNEMDCYSGTLYFGFYCSDPYV